MIIKLPKSTLKPPLIRDPAKWKKAGDPRPTITTPNTPVIEIVSEEMTPYTATLNGKKVKNDGTGSEQSITEGITAPGPLAITIEPTSLDPPRYYRTLTGPGGEPRQIRKEKASLQLPWPLATTDTYFFGFDMRFDPAFEPPPAPYNAGQFCILFQVWHGQGAHPPLALLARPTLLTGKVNCVVEAENTTTEDTPREVITVFEFDVSKGEWQDFRWRLQPNYTEQPGTGEITMWLNNVAQTWRGDWGFAPFEGRPTRAEFHLGIYRATQAKRQSVMFKEIAFGLTYEELTIR
jgi:hypothetical protein